MWKWNNLVPLGARALAVDLATHTLWRLDAQGRPLQQLWLPGMQQAQARWHLWHRASLAIVIVFILALIAGFGFGIKDALRQRKPSVPVPTVARAAAMHRPPSRPATTIWLEPQGLQARIIVTGFIFAVTFAVSALVLWLVTHGIKPASAGELWFWWCALIGMPFLGVGLIMSLNAYRDMAIGVRGDELLLRNADGRRTAGRGAQIVRGQNLLVIGDLMVPIASTNRVVGSRGGLWPRRAFTQHVAPLLEDARNLTPLQELRITWRAHPWPFLIMAAGVAVALAGELAKLLL